MRSRNPGFTLVEVTLATGCAALLFAAAAPAMLDRVAAARRGDATVALERLQAAQERHRELHGHYAADLAALGAPSSSPEGLYTLTLEASGALAYAAAARPRAGGPQEHDGLCDEITLRVDQGFATAGPSPRCWGR